MATIPTANLPKQVKPIQNKQVPVSSSPPAKPSQPGIQPVQPSVTSTQSKTSTQSSVIPTSSGPPANPMNNNVWVREYLRSQGYNDDQIGWNQNTGAVTLNGQIFYKPSAENAVGGKAYGTLDELNQAMNNYRMNQLYGQMYNQATQQKPYNPQDSPYYNQINNLISQLQSRANQPFVYDPASDPAYQAALNQANRNAELASRSAMEDLNERGILNSTVTSDRLGQIRQDAMSYVSDTVLPQLMQQAYNREQQGIANLMNVLGALQQQQGFQEGVRQFDVSRGDNLLNNVINMLQQQQSFNEGVRQFNQNFNENQRQYNEQFAYQQLRDQIKDKQWQQQFDEDVRRFGLNYALDRQIQLGNLSARQAEIALSRNQQNLNNLFNVWEMTGSAPAGLERFGVQAGTPLPSAQSQNNKISDRESASNYYEILSVINNNAETKEQALAYLQDPEVSKLLSDSDYRKALQYINDNF
jgi:hypothetical protein